MNVCTITVIAVMITAKLIEIIIVIITIDLIRIIMFGVFMVDCIVN